MYGRVGLNKSKTNVIRLLFERILPQTRLDPAHVLKKNEGRGWKKSLKGEKKEIKLYT